jgi:hypothetical protein
MKFPKVRYHNYGLHLKSWAVGSMLTTQSFGFQFGPLWIYIGWSAFDHLI